jgi:hypothetical protein
VGWEGPGLLEPEKMRRRTNLARETRAALAPLGILALLIVFYVGFQSLFTSCKAGPWWEPLCAPFNAEVIFVLDQPGPIDRAGGLNLPAGEQGVRWRRIISDRHTGRIAWVFFAALCALLSLVALVVAFNVIWKSDLRSRVWHLLGSATAFGVVVLFYPHAFMPLMAPVLDETIAQVSTVQLGMPRIRSIMQWLNAVTYAGAFALVLASWAALRPRDEAKAAVKAGTPPGHLALLDEIAEQMADLRLVLYVGTSVLITGILRMGALSTWSLAFISEAAVPAATSFNASNVAVTGGFYTLVLTAIYLPAAANIHWRARKELTTIGDDAEKTLRDRKLSLSAKDVLPRAVAILGPLLAGPAGELLRWMTS